MWRALLNMVMNHRAIRNVGNLTSGGNTSLSRRSAAWSWCLGRNICLRTFVIMLKFTKKCTSFFLPIYLRICSKKLPLIVNPPKTP